MRGTKIVIGLSMCAIVAALTSYPVGAKAQLSMMGGTAAAPQINNGALAGGQRAIQGAKADKASADARAKAVNELMEDEGGASAQPALSKLDSKVYSAGELIGAVESKGAPSLQGAPVRVDGIVLKVIHANNLTSVFVGAPQKTETSPVFMVRLNGTHNYEAGSRLSFEGKFQMRMKMDGLNNDVYYVIANQAGGSSTADASAGTGEVKEPEPFDGWKFIGSVEAEGGATGVFVREGQTLYAQPGDYLSDGVQVVRMRAGEAVLREEGDLSVVSPW